MERDQRPWVGGPTSIESSTRHGGTLTVTFRNIGSTPTDGYFIDGKIVDGAVPNFDSNKEANTIYASMKQVVGSKRPINGLSAIPETDWSVEIRSMPSRDATDLEKLRAMSEPYLVGCVLYGSGEQLHRTMFAARLEMRAGEDTIKIVQNYTMGAD